MSEDNRLSTSPKWNAVTKIIAGFTLMAAIAGLMLHFQSIIPQLLMIIILAYLVNPVANFVDTKTPLPWKASVAVVFVLLVGLYISFITWSGVNVVKQILNLVEMMRNSISQLPALIEQFTSSSIVIGPLQFNVGDLNIATYEQQIMQASQSVIRLIADGLAKIAGGTANFIGWSFIIFLGAFFVLFEETELWKGIFIITIPGYDRDIQQFREHFANIWNSFFRGQLTVMTIAIIVYIIVLSALGVRYALGIAIIAGLVRFVPYIGTFFFWVILIVVTIFQDNTIFGLEKLTYIAIVVVCSYLIDWVMDYMLTPRIMSTALKVHPALIMIGAIVGYGLLGLLGVLVAAPLVASLLFIARYIFKKLLDMDPWEGLAPIPESSSVNFIQFDKVKAVLAKIKIKK